MPAASSCPCFLLSGTYTQSMVADGDAVRLLTATDEDAAKESCRQRIRLLWPHCSSTSPPTAPVELGEAMSEESESETWWWAWSSWEAMSEESESESHTHTHRLGVQLGGDELLIALLCAIAVSRLIPSSRPHEDTPCANLGIPPLQKRRHESSCRAWDGGRSSRYDLVRVCVFKTWRQGALSSP